MNFFTGNWKNKLKIHSSRQIYIYSVVIGLVTGLVAVVFATALSTAEHFTFEILAGIHVPVPDGEAPSLIPEHFKLFVPIPSWLVLFCLPIIGGLFVGIILRFFCKEAQGAGTDRLISAFHYQKGKIGAKVSVYKAVSSIFTLATGGSGGKEGPTAYIGASLGSFLSKILKSGARARRTLLLAGAAGGLGAIFRAPLGGAMTAVEIVYREDIESDSLVPCLIASVTSYLIFIGIMGEGSLFQVGGVGLKDYRELFIYILLGLLCYAMGFMYVRVLRFMEKVAILQKTPLLLRPALGGVAIGIFAMIVPEVLGSGMGFVHDLINSICTSSCETVSSTVRLADNLPRLAGYLFLIALLKILATSITLASGASAGLFAPSMFIGAMLGGSLSIFSSWLFPEWTIHIPSFMLVGMAAFFSGVARTPFSAMIMISDIIGSYALLPPLMVVSMLTFILSRGWSLYRGQVHNRFKSPAHFWDMRLDRLEKLKIKEVVQEYRKEAIVQEGQPLDALLKLSRDIDTQDFILQNRDESYAGILSLKKLQHKVSFKKLHTDEMEDKYFAKKGVAKALDLKQFADPKIPAVDENASLAKALRNIKRSELDKVGIIDCNQRIIGYILSQDIFHIYHRHGQSKPGLKKISLPDTHDKS